ncbi:MAG: PaaI family thioesterase [Xanthobacteraceae bacterium]|nr:PaaI family thioesterase [Xanthobacteraceae bacterium]
MPYLEAEVLENPDRLFIADFMAQGLSDMPISSSKIYQDLSARLVAAAPGRVTLCFAAGERSRQGDGIVHGGVVSTMLDSAMAFAALSTLGRGESAATVSLTVNFLTAVKEGACTVSAGLDKIGKRVAHARATLSSASGTTAATASAVFTLLRRS